MRYLLDVNTLVAWGWKDHPLHERAASWIMNALKNQRSKFFTSAIPETGFIRVSVLRAGGIVSVELCVEILTSMIDQLGQHHRFLPDDLTSRRPFPAWCKNAKHTTDAHLLALAEKHGLKLATLDTGIPGAFLIP